MQARQGPTECSCVRWALLENYNLRLPREHGDPFSFQKYTLGTCVFYLKTFIFNFTTWNFMMIVHDQSISVYNVGQNFGGPSIAQINTEPFAIA